MKFNFENSFGKPKDSEIENNKASRLTKMAAVMSLALLSLGYAKESQGDNRDKKINHNLEVANKFINTATDQETWNYFTRIQAVGPEIQVGSDTPFGRGMLACVGSSYNNESKLILSKITEGVDEKGEKVEHKTIAIDADADGEIDFIANKTVSEKELGFTVSFDGEISIREKADGSVSGVTPKLGEQWQRQEKVNKDFFDEEIPQAIRNLSADGGISSDKITMEEVEKKIKEQFREGNGYYVVNIAELEKANQEEIQAGFAKVLEQATKIMEDAKSKRPADSGRYNAHEGYGQQY